LFLLDFSGIHSFKVLKDPYAQVAAAELIAIAVAQQALTESGASSGVRENRLRV
jgi:hypothetical protein